MKTFVLVAVLCTMALSGCGCSNRDTNNDGIIGNDNYADKGTSNDKNNDNGTTNNSMADDGIVNDSGNITEDAVTDDATNGTGVGAQSSRAVKDITNGVGNAIEDVGRGANNVMHSVGNAVGNTVR